MTWKQWKQKIRTALEANPNFNIDADDINYLDLVDVEAFELTKIKGLVGLQSKATVPTDED